MECKYLTFNLKQKFSASSSAIAEPITLQELIEIFFGKKKKISHWFYIEEKIFIGQVPTSRPFLI